MTTCREGWYAVSRAPPPPPPPLASFLTVNFRSIVSSSSWMCVCAFYTIHIALTGCLSTKRIKCRWPSMRCWGAVWGCNTLRYPLGYRLHNVVNIVKAGRLHQQCIEFRTACVYYWVGFYYSRGEAKPAHTVPTLIESDVPTQYEARSIKTIDNTF